MSGTAGEADLIRVVLADANVLYPRVLRDYLLYAADQETVAIAWSSQILAEVTEHPMENVEGFDQAAAQRLVGAMNRAFPYAEVEPYEEHWRVLDQVPLPDEDDRHVLAAEAQTWQNAPFLHPVRQAAQRLIAASLWLAGHPALSPPRIEYGGPRISRWRVGPADRSQPSTPCG
jgi:hypothetical protein